MVLSSCTVVSISSVSGTRLPRPGNGYQVFLLTDEYLFLKHSVQNGKAFSSIQKTSSCLNKALTGVTVTFLVSKLRLKTTPTFALEKQTRFERKQTRFILTLPVAGAVWWIVET